ncbi:primosomal protein N' [Halochromatium salexigens]|uniref:Replication restart protein PriA n=1 Tax=Halochromatium salexigens TaxID=49447 RepID=A0AAJ0XHR0_HALSE|nr:primosomal protein N' [Halochromatium salexigens]MBK5931875.1 primosomal protein N' [Halochromatium salexigens]
MAIVQVAVAAPLAEVFDYLLPSQEADCALGQRVLVPFGRSRRVGMIVARKERSSIAPERLKAIECCLDREPLLGAEDLALIRWAADYYRCPPGEAIFSALPARLRRPVPSAPAPSDDAVPFEPAPSPTLNAEQQAAIAAVHEAQGFQCFLLDGVTGSGKTEVYIRLISAALERGRQVLVLVPEIGLTPQLAERFAQRLDTERVVLHSGLTERERERGWQRAARGQARLILGTRSAIFTPLPDLGLVIVDEEHDVSLKQQDGFRYSARDLAVRRAQIRDCPVLLGSATPSLETLRNAERGRYRHLHLRRRAGGAEPPRFLVVDVRSQHLITGLSHALLTRMTTVIEAGNQVLLFLNRRGFAPVLTCHDCGWISVCLHCDARMTLHRDRGLLICHHCGDQRTLPVHCPECESPDLRPLGQGTERVEDSLRQRFPGIPLARIDRDSTRRKGDLERLLAAAREGAYPLLLGTQMLAKGHHLPGVTLVGILDLDHGLYGSDFRATERMAQLLIQVAGRAGRAEQPGTVMLQTRHPDHPLLIRLLRQGYGAFADAALAERAEAALPPFSFQALVRADSRVAQRALDFLREARARVLALDAGPVQVWGPAPASMERRAGRFRAQLLLQCAQRAPLHALIDRLLPSLRALSNTRTVRWSLDIDPQESL